MSSDTVDDLHAAEDVAGLLAVALERLVKAVDTDVDVGVEYGAAFDNARDALAWWAGFCRPCCGADGDHAECEEDDPDSCGCPCGHASGSA